VNRLFGGIGPFAGLHDVRQSVSQNDPFLVGITGPTRSANVTPGILRPTVARLDLYGEASQSQAQTDCVVYPTQRTAERRGTRGDGVPLLADDHGAVRRLL
jgi:hypothetical protein